MTRPPPDYKDQRRNVGNMQPAAQYSGKVFLKINRNPNCARKKTVHLVNISSLPHLVFNCNILESCPSSHLTIFPSFLPSFLLFLPFFSFFLFFFIFYFLVLPVVHGGSWIGIESPLQPSPQPQQCPTFNPLHRVTDQTHGVAKTMPDP